MARIFLLYASLATLANADTYKLGFLQPDTFYSTGAHSAVDFATWWINNDPFPVSVLPSLLPNDTLKVTHLGQGVPATRATSPIEFFNLVEDILANETYALVSSTEERDLAAVQTLLASRRALHVSWTQHPQFQQYEDDNSTLFRVLPNEAEEAWPTVNWIKSMGWTDCSLIADFTTTTGIFYQERFLQAARSVDLNVDKTGGYTVEIDEDGNEVIEVKDLLDSIKGGGYHVIVMYCSNQLRLIEVLRQAKEIGLIGDGYVWIVNPSAALSAEFSSLDSTMQATVSELFDGMYSLAPQAAALPPVEPCYTQGQQYLTIAQGLSGTAQAETAATGNQLISADGITCFSLLWNILYSTAVCPVVPPAPSQIYGSFIAFEAYYATAHALSRMVDVVNECASTSNLQPSVSKCAQIQTLEGRREVIIEMYQSQPTSGFIGNPQPTNGKEAQFSTNVMNIRKSAIEALIGGSSAATSVVVGIIIKPTFNFVPYSTPQFFGGDTTVPSNRVSAPEENKQHIKTSFVIVGYVVYALLMAMALFFISWTLYNYNLPVVRAAQPIFLSQIVLGSCVSSLVIIFGSWDDRNYSENWLNASCNLEVWAYGIGFAITYSGLFTKMWKAKAAILDPCRDLIVHKISPLQMAGFTMACLLVEVLILGTWTGEHGFRWTRRCDEKDIWDQCVKSEGFCATSSPWSLIVPISVFHVGAMIYALHLCYICRSIPQTFAEVQWITTAIVSSLQVFILAFFILLIVHENPSVFYLIKVFVVLLSEGSVLTCMFAPRIYRAYSKFEEDESTRKVIDNMDKWVKQKNNAALGHESKRRTRPSSPSHVMSNHSHLNDNDSSHMGSVKNRLSSPVQTTDNLFAPRRETTCSSRCKSATDASKGDTDNSVVLVV